MVSRHQALTSNVSEEVRLLRAIKASNIDTVRELMTFQGGNPRFELDPAIDPKLLPGEVLASYNAFRESVQFKPEDVAAQWRALRLASSPILDDPARSGQAPDPAGPIGLDVDARDIGSNNWVISGARTLSTRPILANDPHRVIAAPSLR